MTIYIGPENFDLHIELFWGPGDSYFVMLHWMPRMKQMIKHEFQRKLSEMAFQAGQDLVTSCFFFGCSPQDQSSMDWFKGKSTGNYGFSH